MLQSIEMAVRRDITVSQRNMYCFRRDITVLQSIEIAFRRDMFYVTAYRDR